MNPVRVLIVDDHRVFAEAIATRLEAEPDIVVVGTAATGREALSAIDELRPDLVMMDVELAGEDGIEVAARLREQRPDLVLAVVSCLSDPVRVRDAVGVGAFAWVTKDAPIEELLSAIRDNGGSITPAEAAMQTSLTVREADGMLSELAGGGHLSVQSRDGSLFYVLPGRRSPELEGRE